jgi:hypothetical protein
MRYTFRNLLPATLLALVATAPVAAQGLAPDVFASVDGTVITAGEFTTAVHAGARRKFYHGSIPEAQMASFQREVGEGLIEQVLLLREAGRRGIQPAPDWVAPRLDAFERRSASHPAWEARREELMRAADAQLKDESRILNLRSVVQEQVGLPSPEELRAYYEANPEKFTEPERFRVSVILLKVEPSAPGSAWKAAEEEARAIAARLRDGADFAETARLRSGDASAAAGGDMGYLHRGMLGARAQAAVDASRVGAIVDPVRLLEGVAIFRVDERPEPRLLPLAEVADRARELWLREQRTDAWDAFRRGLREQADVSVNEQHYLPLPD